MTTLVKSYLGESAFVQNAKVKPGSSTSGERSQDGPARDRHEVADLQDGAGLLLGRSGGRASVAYAKPIGLAPISDRYAVTQAVSWRHPAMVVHVITFQQWLLLSTGELPPRRKLIPSVTASYKLYVKSRPDARATLTPSQRRRPWGTQQRQSSPAPPDERQNLREVIAPPGFMGIVSPAPAAPKWPAGTSFRQRATTAKKRPHTLPARSITDSHWL